MRQILITIIFIALSQLGLAQKATFQGKINGIDTAIIVVQVLPLEKGSDDYISDTIRCIDGKFSYEANFSRNAWYLVRLSSKAFNDVFGNEKLCSPKSCSEELNNREIVFFIQPNDTVSISANIGEYGIFYQCYGNEINNQRSQTVKNIFPLEEAINRLRILKEKAEKSNDSEKATQLANEINMLNEQIRAIELKTIVQHPDWIYSAEIIAVQPIDTIRKYLEIFTPDVKNSFFGLYLPEVINVLTIKAGLPAPEFTLINDKGKNVSLNDFKGKYLVIDFWGTWCGVCLRGIPRMKEYYSKYKDKIEFVSIDCRDNKEVWLKAIKKHQMSWINLFAENKEIINKYGVEGFPTKIIIDKNGIIVLKSIGEEDDFYEKLDELFK